MSRTLSAEMQSALSQQQIKTFLLIHFAFSTDVYLTTWSRSIVYGGNTYLPGIGILKISSIKETANVQLNSLNITLSGANLSNVSVALSENYINRKVTILRAILDSQPQVIASPIQHDYYVTNFSFQEDPSEGTASLTWALASHWADFERVAGRRSNNEDQQYYYPGDKGLEYSGDKVVDLKWGRS